MLEKINCNLRNFTKRFLMHYKTDFMMKLLFYSTMEVKQSDQIYSMENELSVHPSTQSNSV